MILFLHQIDWNKLRPEVLFGGQVLERTPAGLSIFYLIGIGILLGFLMISFFDNFKRPKFLFELDLPREVTRRLTRTVANRSLRIWQVVFIYLHLASMGSRFTGRILPTILTNSFRHSPTKTSE